MTKIPIVLGSLVASAVTVATIAFVAPRISGVAGVAERFHSAPVASDPFMGIHFSAAEREQIAQRAETEPLSPYTTYESATHGYSVRFPGTWMLDDSREISDGDIITEPTQKLVIVISEGDDVATGDGKDVAQQLTWKGHPTLFSSEHRDFEGETWDVREWAITRPDRDEALLISISAMEGSEHLFEEDIAKFLRDMRI